MQKKAIFLDRDGVINKKRDDYVKSIEELEIFPNIAKYLKILKDNGFLLIIVTNQSAVNRGVLSIERLEKINRFLIKQLEKEGCKIDDVFYCPHRPDEGCDCRKPKSGLLQQASTKYKIDLKQSWIIGDCDSDIEAGKNVGCRGIKININESILKSVNHILKEENTSRKSI